MSLWGDGFGVLQCKYLGGTLQLTERAFSTRSHWGLLCIGGVLNSFKRYKISQIFSTSRSLISDFLLIVIIYFSLQTVLKQKLLNPILQAIFPVLTAAPPPGEQDPEDEEDDSGDGTDNENPKHCAAQVFNRVGFSQFSLLKLKVTFK